MKARALLLLSIPCAVALAQDPAPLDPFATPAPIRRAANGGRVERGLRGDVAGLDSSSTDLPPLAVRAVLVVRGRPPAALLEVAGETYLVKPGARLHVVREGLDLPLEVLDVGPDGVRVKAPDGAVVQVRQ